MTRTVTRMPAILSILALTACSVPDLPWLGGGDTDADPATDLAALGPGPVLDHPTALALMAMPLACLSRPHDRPSRTGYIWDATPAMRVDYHETRAFYGCYDWHSAVNSAWTLAALVRRFPEGPVSRLALEKLGEHLQESQLQGEGEYFEENPTFERPYGWAWFLALHAELTRLSPTVPQAVEWVERSDSLADRFARGLEGYFLRLDYPNRVGTHANTAYSMDLALDYARTVADTALDNAITSQARMLYGADRACPLAYEPSASDFLSPCLETAKLMGVVLPREAFLNWLNEFLPAATDSMGPLAQPIRIADEPEGEELDDGLRGAKSHLIGLAFARAEALDRIAALLPSDDPRRPRYRQLSRANAAWGMESLFEADYLGTHWIGTFATRYLLSLAATTAPPTPPPTDSARQDSTGSALPEPGGA
ncbi:MAG: DUF2891 family protein [Gemmatimonadota bacterium]